MLYVMGSSKVVLIGAEVLVGGAPPTFMMPFQLSPVETWNRVRKAMPKFSKVA